MTRRDPQPPPAHSQTPAEAMLQYSRAVVSLFTAGESDSIAFRGPFQLQGFCDSMKISTRITVLVNSLA